MEMPEPVILVANGDLRLSANQKCWPAQSRVEDSVMAAIRSEGFEVRRGHPFDAAKQHGFIDSQKRGMGSMHRFVASALKIQASTKNRCSWARTPNWSPYRRTS